MISTNQEAFIVIDPSHGGKDPGAVSKKFNLREKDVNLAITPCLLAVATIENIQKAESLSIL